MAIPDYQTLMLPFLRAAGDGEPHRSRDIATQLAGEFDLSDAEKSQLLPSGRQTVMMNRIGWASTYLRHAGLLAAVQRGVVQITPLGRDVLAKKPDVINTAFLNQFPPFVAFRVGFEKPESDKSSSHPAPDSRLTAEEVLEDAHQSIRDLLASELLDRVMSGSPQFFEDLVLELLLKMGYGGSRKDAGERVGQSGDGGIDGIIKQDRLGLDVIYIQAKRWQGSVGRPELQKFVGALQGHHARKGVFITTSTFTSDAEKYAPTVDSKVILIDGRRLTDLMIDFDLGVSTAATYSVKRVDSDYFDQE